MNCVICGKEIKDRTKEHVIPMWLIEMSGDTNRPMFMGYNIKGGEQRKWKDYHFPACDSCNSEYNEIIEMKAKPVFEKIFSKQSLNSLEINILLDFIDKIRIGTWLISTHLNNYPQGDVNFHIGDRMGKKDRALFVYKVDNPPPPNDKRLMFPLQSLIFYHMPSIFYLSVNEYIFYSFSCENLLLESLGFPFLRNPILMENLTLAYKNIGFGHEKITKPLVNFIIPKTEIKIFQAIVPIDNHKFDNAYVKDNLENGLRSYIFYEKGNELKKLTADIKILIEPTISHSALEFDTNLFFTHLDNQKLLHKQQYANLSFESKKLEKNHKKYMNKLYAENDKFIKLFEKRQ